jgi:hypothetical protein
MLTHPQLSSGTLLELRIALPDGEWPLAVERARVTDSQWDACSIAFISVHSREHQRLRDFLLKPVTLQEAPRRLISLRP